MADANLNQILQQYQQRGQRRADLLGRMVQARQAEQLYRTRPSTKIGVKQAEFNFRESQRLAEEQTPINEISFRQKQLDLKEQELRVGRQEQLGNIVNQYQQGQIPEREDFLIENAGLIGTEEGDAAFELFNVARPNTPILTPQLELDILKEQRLGKQEARLGEEQISTPKQEFNKLKTETIKRITSIKDDTGSVLFSSFIVKRILDKLIDKALGFPIKDFTDNELGVLNNQEFPEIQEELVGFVNRNIDMIRKVTPQRKFQITPTEKTVKQKPITNMDDEIDQFFIVE